VYNELNLSRRPFLNRTLPWVVAITVGSISFLLLVVTIYSTMGTRKALASATKDRDKLNQEIKSLKEKEGQVRDALNIEEKESLKSAHNLVDRKSFSWSKLLAELESFVPGDVYVKRITVRDVNQRSGPTVVDLDLAVVGRTPQDVTRMVSDLEGSGIFNAYPVSSEAGRGDGVEWVLKVLYKPRASLGPDSSPKNNDSGNVASAKAEPSATVQPSSSKTKGGEQQ
jgi:Tfp pilus assembly protein PilN